MQGSIFRLLRTSINTLTYQLSHPNRAVSGHVLGTIQYPSVNASVQACRVVAERPALCPEPLAAETRAPADIRAGSVRSTEHAPSRDP